MARARRDWDAIRPEIYALLREDEATAYWTAPLILQLFNQCLDLRTMQLGQQHEGWITETKSINIVANTAEYAIGEDSDRLKRALIVTSAGSGTYEAPLVRDEKWSKGVFNASGSVGDGSHAYTARLKEDKLILEPTPTENLTNGLKLEYESLPDRISAGDDMLPLRYPLALETLLIYDTACAALEVEDAVDNISLTKGEINGLYRFRDHYAAIFFDFTAERFFGRVFSEPFNLGD